MSYASSRCLTARATTEPSDGSPSRDCMVRSDAHTSAGSSTLRTRRRARLARIRSAGVGASGLRGRGMLGGEPIANDFLGGRRKDTRWCANGIVGIAAWQGQRQSNGPFLIDLQVFGSDWAFASQASIGEKLRGHLGVNVVAVSGGNSVQAVNKHAESLADLSVGESVDVCHNAVSVCRRLIASSISKCNTSLLYVKRHMRFNAKYFGGTGMSVVETTENNA